MKYRTLGRTGLTFRKSRSAHGRSADHGGSGRQHLHDNPAQGGRFGCEFFRYRRCLWRWPQASSCSRVLRNQTAQCGRSLSPPRSVDGSDPHVVPGITTGSTSPVLSEQSLVNLQTEADRPAAAALPAKRGLLSARSFGDLDDLTRAGKIRNYGVSVEKVEQAIKAISSSNVKTVQIIFNVFRHRPAEIFSRWRRRRTSAFSRAFRWRAGYWPGRSIATRSSPR